MAIEDHYKFLRRRIAKCGCGDSLYVVWAYSQFLQVRSFNFPKNIDKHESFLADGRLHFLIHEWELEIIATEVILHAVDGPKTMRDWPTLANIVTRLRRLENELYGDNENADIQIELSRIMHRQIVWQQFRPQTKLTYRYHRIFSDPAVDAICRKVVGLSVDALYYQGILAYLHFAKAPALELSAHTTPETQALLKFAARPLSEVRDLIADAHALNHSYAYRVGPLTLFPLLIVEDANRILVLSPVPTLFFWRLTSGLYYDLIKGDADFGNALGASFERYIGEVISRVATSAAFQHFGEAKYGTKRHPKATCDWMLVEGDTAAVFIECKTKRITVAAKTAMGDLSPLKHDIGKLADAIVQLYERLQDYAAGLFPTLSYVPDRKCYPVVVTLEEWYLFGERVMALLREAVESKMREAGLELDWLDRAPYSILSTDEFEDAIQIINMVGIGMCFESKLSDREMRSWPFGNYLRHHFAEEWKARKPIFPDEAKAMLNRLAAQANATPASS
jgi:hypothetical protein